MADLTNREALVAIQKREIEEARARGEEFFMDLPDAWYEPQPTYGCENGHVSHRYLKSETRGCLCIDCHTSLVLLPGRFTDDETLTAAIAAERAR